MLTVMSQCQAYLYYRFWAGVLFFTGFQPTKVGLIRMSVLTYLITGYASLLQKCRKHSRELICINPHNQLSSAKELIGTRFTPLNGETV